MTPSSATVKTDLKKLLRNYLSYKFHNNCVDEDFMNDLKMIVIIEYVIMSD